MSLLQPPLPPQIPIITWNMVDYKTIPTREYTGPTQGTTYPSVRYKHTAPVQITNTVRLWGQHSTLCADKTKLPHHWPHWPYQPQWPPMPCTKDPINRSTVVQWHNYHEYTNTHTQNSPCNNALHVTPSYFFASLITNGANPDNFFQSHLLQSRITHLETPTTL